MKNDTVLLGHGSGGMLSHTLITNVVQPCIGMNRPLDDAAILRLTGERLAFTTDSFVVDPLFFPGGDIGTLAVCGTVNDLCMMGAVPQYISLGLIIEEGLPLDDLRRIATSIGAAAREAGVEVVTGDTKVVARGGADRLFINTSGIGTVREGLAVSGSGARVGDAVIVTGSMGEHGIAVLSQREGIRFDTSVSSDCAPLHGLLAPLADLGGDLHVLRDPTRGGLATTLNEIAAQSGVGIAVDETAIPVSDGVRAACELLGFDPLYVANEGKAIVIVSPDAAARTVAMLRSHVYGAAAAIIGRVVADYPRRVVLATATGGRRILDMMAGEQLPRIC